MSGERQLNHKEIIDELQKIVFFPGSKQEYEEMVGYKVKIIDSGFKDRGLSLFFNGSFYFYGDHIDERNKTLQLINEGVEALVNCRLVYSDRWVRHGLPVTRVKEKEVKVERVK